MDSRVHTYLFTSPSLAAPPKKKRQISSETSVTTANKSHIILFAVVAPCGSLAAYFVYNPCISPAMGGFLKLGKVVRSQRVLQTKNMMENFVMYLFDAISSL